jgi:DUF4097 and DUF4098 domain-containing protein YvlB
MNRTKVIVMTVFFGLALASGSKSLADPTPGDGNGLSPGPRQAGRPRRYETTFPVIATPTLQVFNSSIRGSVNVKTWERRVIKVAADIYSPTTSVNASKSNEIVTVKLRRQGQTVADAVNFDIVVPADCVLEVSAVSGPITIQGAQGKLKVRTADGNIALQEVTSKEIDASSSTTGNVLLSGKLLPEGKYNLYSGKGVVEVVLPENASFILDATTHEGRIEPEEFRFSSEARTASHVEGICGTGSASLKLQTHSGRIRVRKQQ